MSTEENPYQAPLAGPAVPPATTVARRQLLPVAIGLLVTSVLHIFGGLNFCVYVYMASAAGGGEPNPMIAYAMFSGVTMLYCLVLIAGAVSMMRYSSYMWAVTVCILALVPGFGPCYFFAIPFGIWGLLILRRAEVRDSFVRP